MNRVIIGILIVGLLIGLTAWRLMSNVEAAKEKVYLNNPNKAVSVQTAVAEVRSLSGTNAYLGTFEPNREVRILSETSGKVISLSIQEGQGVGAGQVIAQVDNEILRYQLESSEIALQGHQRDVNRYSNLVKSEATPGVNLEKAELNVRATQAQIKQQKKQISNTTITAPFSGIITQKQVEIGSVLAPGTPLAQLTDISALKLTINVPERDVLKFKDGQAVKISTDVHAGVVFNGRVVMIGAKGDAAHNYPVQILVSNSAQYPLKAGMYGSVANDSQVKAEALVIPRSALIGSAKQAQVFVAENGKATLRSIQTGLIYGDWVEIIGGLKAGERVVTAGQINLENGSTITTIANKN